jgi:hypothetical protein
MIQDRASNGVTSNGRPIEELSEERVARSGNCHILSLNLQTYILRAF